MIFLIFALFLLAICHLGMAVDVEKAFSEHQVVPDVIDVAPRALLTIKYQCGAEVKLGNELTPTQVKDIPTVQWAASNDAFYTLLMVDPDAPSRTDAKLREVRHWAVFNIPGSNVEKGETVVEYLGSGPPQGTGLHRYVFVVYKQPNGKITHNEPFTSNRNRDNRLNTKAADLVLKYNLGNPIAGNFYQAQYDDYVPILHAQFSSQ